MSYFPGDIPFMSKEELRENGIKIPKDATDTNVGTKETIYRQDAIDALKEHRALYCDNTPVTFAKLSYAEKSRVDELDTAIATLVNLPPAQPEQRWIPCSERLPDKQTKVLVVDFDEVDTAYLNSEGRWMDYHGDKLKDVKAWMPLPKWKGDVE